MGKHFLGHLGLPVLFLSVSARNLKVPARTVTHLLHLILEESIEKKLFSRSSVLLKWSNAGFEKLNKLFLYFFFFLLWSCLSELLWWCVARQSFLKAAFQQLYSAVLHGDKCLIYRNCSSRRCFAAFIHLFTLLFLFIIVALCTPLFLKILFSFFPLCLYKLLSVYVLIYYIEFSIWSKVICYALLKTLCKNIS